MESPSDNQPNQTSIQRDIISRRRLIAMARLMDYRRWRLQLISRLMLPIEKGQDQSQTDSLKIETYSGTNDIKIRAAEYGTKQSTIKSRNDSSNWICTYIAI